MLKSSYERSQRRAELSSCEPLEQRRLLNAVSLSRPQPLIANLSDVSCFATGDLNGDGKPDIVVAGGAFLNKGDGSYEADGRFDFGFAPVGLAIADVNGDGSADIITAGDNDSMDTNIGTVSVLLADGSGGFKAPQSYPTGANGHGLPISFVVADVNDDGRPDIIVETVDSIELLLNQGNGTFGPATTVASFGDSASLSGFAVADLGNGSPDIVVANQNASTVSILLNNGNGTFQSPQSIDVGDFPTSLAVADLNGDGKPDIAVACGGSETLNVLLGRGNGTFFGQNSFPIGTPNQGTDPIIAVADVSGDGTPDVIVADEDGVGVLAGNGDGTFQPIERFPSPIGGGVAVADLGGDGAPAILTSDQENDAIDVLYCNEAVLPAPVLQSPTSTADNQPASPAFTWSSVDGATTYQLIVATDPSSLPIQPTDDIDESGSVDAGYINTSVLGTNYSPPSGMLQPATTYYWEVQAANSAQYGAWSSVSSFTAAPLPAAPTITAPSNGNADEPPVPEFDWQAIGGSARIPGNRCNEPFRSAHECKYVWGWPDDGHRRDRHG